MVRECIFAAFGSTILKLYPFGTNMVVPSWICGCAGLPKKTPDTSLPITGATRGTTTEKLYQELSLKSSKKRRRLR